MSDYGGDAEKDGQRRETKRMEGREGERRRGRERARGRKCNLSLCVSLSLRCLSFLFSCRRASQRGLTCRPMALVSAVPQRPLLETGAGGRERGSGEQRFARASGERRNDGPFPGHSSRALSADG